MEGSRISPRPGVAGLVAAGLVLLLHVAPVAAQRLVISDLSGETDDAGAVSLLLRSILATGQRPAVARQEMTLALDRVPGAKSANLLVNVSSAAALMKDLGADRLLAGELAKDDIHLTLTLKVYDRDGSLVAANSVRVARGEVANLAVEAARKIAGTLGTDVRPVDATLGELRPFVRAAQALGAGNPKAAADALRVAGRTVAQRVPAAKEVADMVWRDQSLPTDSRVVAALAAGENKEAVRIGGGDPKNVDARAQTARARLATSDVHGAEKELKAVKSDASGSSALALARAELALKKGKKADAERELGPLLNKSPPDPAALAFMASLPPSTFSGATEALALTAAQRSAKSQPGVASQIGLRAAKGGAAKGDALGLVDTDDCGPTDLSDIDALLEGDSSPVGKGMQGAIAARRKDGKPVVLPGLPGVPGGIPGGLPGALKGILPGKTPDGGAPRTAKTVAVSGNATVATGSGARQVVDPSNPGGTGGHGPGQEVTPQIAEIAKLMVPLLEAFPPLAERRAGTAVLYPMKGGGEPPWSLYSVNATPLRFGLAHAISQPPFNLGVVEGSKTVGELTHDKLGRLSKQSGATGDFIVLYKLTAEEGNAHVYLSLYEVEGGQLYEFDDKISGTRTGLVRYNLLLLPFAGGAVFLLILYLALVVLRTGEVSVEIKRDPAGEDEQMVLIINKNPKPPAIPEIYAFHKAAKQTGPKQSRLKQTSVVGRTTFPRVPAGIWYVHLYGTFMKGGEVRPLPDNLTKKVIVKKGDHVHVKLDVDPNATEYRVRVTEGGPIAGALVYLDGDKSKVILTDPQGQAMLHIPRGPHVVHVDVKEMQFTREVDSTGGKVQVLTFDLARERLDKKLAGGIEIVQESDDWKPKVPTAQPAQAETRQPSGDTRPAEPEDDGISLPEGFSIPMATKLETPTQVGAAQATVPGGNSGAARARAQAPTSVPNNGGSHSQKAPLSGIDRYQRVAELGRGAMGIVFKGRDLVLEREVAIKIISDEVRQNPQALEMFFQEAKAMASLNHPNLVTVFDQGQAGNESFMVMEFVDGQTLESVLQQRGTLPIGEALEVVDQICAGLSAAHNRRILHRDLKPANIFLSRDGVVKIGDFGLARAVRQVRLTQTKVVGTPLYMSPEQIRGSGVDFRSDLYSVGCTLFELLTGRPPFVTGEVMYHHMYTAPPKASEITPGLPPEIDALVAKCLEKEKDARMGTADEIRAAIKPLRARFG
jgi:hypothetical protein